jgi:hypothetical protein
MVPQKIRKRIEKNKKEQKLALIGFSYRPASSLYIARYITKQKITLLLRVV